jgi:hypothetical protein
MLDVIREPFPAVTSNAATGYPNHVKVISHPDSLHHNKVANISVTGRKCHTKVIASRGPGKVAVHVTKLQRTAVTRTQVAADTTLKSRAVPDCLGLAVTLSGAAMLCLSGRTHLVYN